MSKRKWCKWFMKGVLALTLCLALMLAGLPGVKAEEIQSSMEGTAEVSGEETSGTEETEEATAEEASGTTGTVGTMEEASEEEEASGSAGTVGTVEASSEEMTVTAGTVEASQEEGSGVAGTVEEKVEEVPGTTGAIKASSEGNAGITVTAVDPVEESTSGSIGVAVATSSDTTWTSTTVPYYNYSENHISDYSYHIAVEGDVTLYLSSSTTLNLNAGLTINDGSSLTVNGGGTLVVTGTDIDSPAIVMGSGSSLTVDGTNVTAQGGGGISASSGGASTDTYTVTVTNSGTLTAYGSKYDTTYAYGGAGIGACGSYLPEGKFVINLISGSLTATGGGNGAGIGGGGATSDTDFDISVSEGTLAAQGGSNGAGIGSGYNSLKGTINLNVSGGSLTATGGGNAAGIGAGSSASTDTIFNIAINGGALTCVGGANAAGIGQGGSNSTCGKITLGLNDGSLTVNGGAGRIQSSNGLEISNNGTVISSLSNTTLYNMLTASGVTTPVTAVALSSEFEIIPVAFTILMNGTTVTDVALCDNLKCYGFVWSGEGSLSHSSSNVIDIASPTCALETDSSGKTEDNSVYGMSLTFTVGDNAAIKSYSLSCTSETTSTVLSSGDYPDANTEYPTEVTAQFSADDLINGATYTLTVTDFAGHTTTKEITFYKWVQLVKDTETTLQDDVCYYADFDFTIDGDNTSYCAGDYYPSTTGQIITPQ
ncbi:MAG: hypothetical protein LUH19_05445 [Lachnospiraceae bacterium]|nr:hypothetical protein [Lachnospiraceae bacterium]